MKSSLAYNSYQQNSVAVESPAKLVEMLYEGILRFASMAKRCIDSEDIEKDADKAVRAAVKEILNMQKKLLLNIK